MIYPLKMVSCHSYVSLSEGNASGISTRFGVIYSSGKLGNGALIGDFIIKTSIYVGFPIAMFDDTGGKLFVFGADAIAHEKNSARPLRGSQVDPADPALQSQAK